MEKEEVRSRKKKMIRRRRRWGTLMLALLDFTLSSRQALQQTVVFPRVSLTGRVLFPVRHAETASSEVASVLWNGGRLGAEYAIF